MSIHSIRLLFIVLVTHSTSGYPNSSIPLEWSNICQSAINLSNVVISCHVGVDDTWDLDHFRNWSAILDNDTLVSLDVMCETRASICLPWPYRARHLDTLKIRNCINTCYFSYFNRPEVLDIPDSLRVFEGYGMTEQFNAMDMLSVDLKSLPPALECGPMSLEVFIYRNTKADIIYPKGFVPKGEDEVTDNIVQTARDINKLKHVCNYRNMKVYDASQRQDSSSVGIYATFINSRFPNLTTLNYSSTEIQAFPSILLSWKGRIEKLQILDLSHNNISRFDLRVQSFEAPIRVINLTYNSIQTIKEAEIGSFQSSVAQVVDVRQNPLRCDCAMADFSNFLRRHPTPKDAGLSLDYEYLWDLTCVDPVSKRGKQISQFSKKALCNLDVVNVASYQAFVAVLAVVVVILVALLILSILYRDNVKLLISRSCRILCGRSPINEQNINDGRHKDESSKSTQEKL
ncbi:toll-like receptor 8 [Haliotis rufescens]|uniref:toll-like receptor 8 n=1 Tax=Haliotis rufescens TaxID=6454 RepID=UPI00201E86F8|nr:toll-like receptor 8 [Haliotis rufescens]